MNNIFKKSNGLDVQIIFFVAFLVLTAASSAFTVMEGSQALVIQFGKIVSDKPIKPGLHFKIPLIQKALYFDTRILNLESEDAKEVIAADQKRVLVDAYTKYVIENPLKFYQTVGSNYRLMSRLRPILESSIREHVGRVSLICLISDCRNIVMDQIQDDMAKNSAAFGVKIIDVKIKRADLPETNSLAIFNRMETDREKEAKEIRAKGEEEAKIIRAEAEKQRDIIISQSEKKSLTIVGEGSARATTIYNEAFNEDVDFYDFMKHMKLYENSFANKESKVKMIFSGDESFLEFLQYRNKKGMKSD